jgi:hypothetical protein
MVKNEIQQPPTKQSEDTKTTVVRRVLVCGIILHSSDTHLPLLPINRRNGVREVSMRLLVATATTTPLDQR